MGEKKPGAEWLILISHAYHQLNKMLKIQPLLIPTYSAGDCDKSFNRKKDTLFFLTQQLHRLIGENLQHLSTYYL